MAHPYVLKLSRRDALSVVEAALLEDMPTQVRAASVGQDLIRERDRPTSSTLLMSGFCGRYNELPDGRRQITSIHVPGDFVDLHSFLLKPMDHGIVALSDCEVAAVPHARLQGFTQEQPHLTRLLWQSTLVDAAIHRQWVVSAGRRSAVEHMAHLICEIALRLKVVDLGDEKGFRLPLTQAVLGDVLGMSSVHINRVLRDLRDRGLATWRGGDVVIDDWAGLTDLAGFDPTYLRLPPAPV